jgi:tetratricopeptide (TPR) repeat protein
MFCKYCGKEIDNDSAYCSYCGTLQSKILINDSPNEFDPKTNDRQIRDSSFEQKPIDPLFLEHDLTFKTAKNYRLLGIFILIIVSIINIVLISGPGIDKESIYLFNSIMLIFKLIIALKITTLAGKLKRNQAIWGLSTLFFAGIALILFGSVKKPLLPEGFWNYSESGKSEFLERYAYKLAKEFNNFTKANQMIKRALEFDQNNHSAYDTRAYINFHLKNYDSALRDSNKAIEMCDDKAIYYFHRGYILFNLNDNLEDSCKDWKKAAEMGSKLAKEALAKHCRQGV